RIAPAGLERYRGEAFGPAYKDSLFSAQFNPHRVQRHIFTRTGATFQTTDSDFLTSSDPDFHPTDVLEDADGSLLVSDTGAWYVDACPISRVAKPDIKGGIYRIRKNDSPMVEDPWGKKLDLEKKSPNELVAFLADARPRVRDHAVELLVEQGEKAVPAVSKLLKSGPDAGRNAAIWILGRINTSVARDAVRSALQDAAPAARIAAARLAGLNGDQGAVPALRENLRNEDPAVRRQAATALGQLKAADAVSDLLSAAAASADRFEEHAIIYALIQVGETGPLIAALDSRDDKDAKSNEDRRRDKAEGNPAVQKAALIALDQMPGSPLTREQFAPFLASNIEDLRKTALWVASHHADWSDVVLEFLQARLRTEDLDASALESLCEAVLAFAANTEIQTMLAALLQDSVLSDERRLFLLDTINRAPLTPFPESWVQTLGALLRSGSDQITVRAIGLLAARAIANFDQDLLALAADSSSSVPVRIAAITGADGRAGKLPAPLTQFLLGEVQQQEDASVRLAAAKALAVAKLDQGELRTLATELLPKADAMTLPALLDLFHENSDETVGLALVKSLEESGIKPNLIPGGLDALLTGFPAPVQEAAAPLRAQAEEESKARIERLVALEPFLGTGDVGRGRRIFFEDTANCHACHAVGNEGGTFGPDLTTIGTVRSAHDLLEAVLFPSASFVPDYEPYRIKTLDDIQAGVILRQSADAITLATGVNAETRIPRADIVEMTRHTVSIMPEGLDVSLSRQDLIDLITFLQSLNQEPWLLPSAVKPPSSQGF
ncbi:MAG: HEAT repeat domain-containing protein, partial [Candidatus Hydrogenedentes bacterium]|nr:HEAT repeat domain-containing protein [Candidatus Hydrogenedentota bacterium]